MFEISPSPARLWTDGKEQAFRTVSLTEGEHHIVSTADGYMGEHHLIAASANSSEQPVVISLEPRPPISDAEYLDFVRNFDDEGGIDAILERQWTDATLANLVRIERMVRDDDPLIDEFLDQLWWLAEAGDEVAQTTLYYAVLEGLPPFGEPADFLGGLDSGSRKGYALATVLQTLHILNELSISGRGPSGASGYS